jgi:transcription initiation factor IIF auxiliary subunit
MAKRPVASVARAFTFVTNVCIFSFALNAMAQDIEADNTSVYVGDGRWNWTVFIKAPPQILEKIHCVDYTLHPTFPNPYQTVCELGDPKRAFAYSQNGWGVFEIQIKVTFKNGDDVPIFERKALNLKHMLHFSAPKPHVVLPITAANTAKQMRPGWWDWTVFVSGPQQALAQVRCVEYTLHPTFQNPVRTVCNRGSGPRAFGLSSSGWGTFTIGIRVILKDGRVQELSHRLEF